VFGNNSGVFDGHIPSAEIDHLGAQAAVRGVESCFAELGSWRRGHAATQISVEKRERIETSMRRKSVSSRGARVRNAGVCAA
jgi:hypothetical protein